MASDIGAQVFWVRGVQFVLFELPNEIVADDRLTQSERAIVELVLRGHATAEIAQLRTVTYHTVANHLAAIYRKLGVGSRAELSALCFEAGARSSAVESQKVLAKAARVP